jgi:hypothetical protein
VFSSNTNRFKDGGLFTNGIMGEKYLINIVEKENPANQNSLFLFVHYRFRFSFMVFNATFNNISVISYIVAVSFIGGGNRSTLRNPPSNI